MQIIGASWVMLCDEAFGIIKNGGVAYENGEIIEVGQYDALVRKYRLADEANNRREAESSAESKKADSSDIDSSALESISATFHHDSVLLPALINAHIHFEFGGNTTSFDYGGFEAWLSSVMQKREGVLALVQEMLARGIQEQLHAGVGSVGAISSYGGDMEALAASPLKVVYFSEAIGSNPAMIDTMMSSFVERVERARKLAKNTRFAKPRFFPAVAIHSPYSVHSEFAKRVLEYARENLDAPGACGDSGSFGDAIVVSAHFLESSAERAWLESGKGWFHRFYTDILRVPNPAPMYDIDSFLRLFEGLKCALVHGTHLNHAESTRLIDAGHSLITCPRSNRLLGGKMLDFGALDSRILQRLGIGTDGASSNANTNLLDELRAGLFGMGGDLARWGGFGVAGDCGEAGGYKKAGDVTRDAYVANDCDANDSRAGDHKKSGLQNGLQNLAQILLLAATKNGAQALGLNNGELKKGKDADIAVFHIQGIADSSQPEVHFILLAKQVSALLINGTPAI
ncbi:hypothetical protein BKN38_00500 [Helicobacter sp. CLO-3]|uniref:aminofutalosine deaminase family hydrolase n=1 Tax=unclassified Helicobacter TaxID=2593540 RepID=UPI000805150B|nr:MULTISPECIES: amidohydrolase family protein [unclassified Helicobacter]OBV28403.1 hypothetical protein BA723_02140 [Helicobacter sp. CLO-3]OHU85911.1 hypothetical protein BKN38_00500 [Helicobacter sp. CLO-3]